jgi:F-type H+-transporting ATPase subunit b
MSNVQRAMSREQRRRDPRKSLFSHFALCALPCAAFFAFLIFHFALVSLVFGAEGGEAHESLFKAYRWQVLNFVILVAVLVYFMNKPLKEFLRKRTEIIEKSLKEAKEAKELAERALAEVEERLKLKDREMEEILARARLSAEKEQDLLVQQGEQMKEKILEQAKNNIDYELRLAKEAIKAEAVEVAMELAEKKLKEKLTREEQIKLIEESLRRMETKN